MKFSRESAKILAIMNEDEFIAISSFLKEVFATVPEEDFVPRTGFNMAYLSKLISEFIEAAEDLNVEF